MKTLLLLTLIIVSPNIYAQTEYADPVVTQILVEQNKANYKDNKEALRNQLLSHATVETWRSAQNDFKKIVDKIDKHLTQAFIVAADITTLYNIYNSLDEMVDYQQKSFQILYKYPWAAGWFYEKQSQVYKSAVDLVGFITVIILSYGDINKMKVSSRKMVFFELNTLVAVLRAQCYSLYQKMRQVEFAQLYKNTSGYQFFNKDKELIKEILKDLKL